MKHLRTTSHWITLLSYNKNNPMKNYSRSLCSVGLVDNWLPFFNKYSPSCCLYVHVHWYCVFMIVGSNLILLATTLCCFQYQQKQKKMKNYAFPFFKCTVNFKIPHESNWTTSIWYIVVYFLLFDFSSVEIGSDNFNIDFVIW